MTHTDSKPATETLKHSSPADNIVLITTEFLLRRNLQLQGTVDVRYVQPSF